jgi:hypothetical protein
MQLSTQHYFYSSEDFYDNATVSFAALHGVVGVDWANHLGLPMHREDTLAQQAAIIKAVNPKTRVFVYRQSELALNVFDNGAKVMYDPSKTNWFVLFPNGSIYNDSTRVANYTMDQFCWDHRNPEVQDYFVNYYAGSAFNQSVVDGVFYDDDGGIWQERSNYPNYPDQYRLDVDAAQQVSLKRAWELGLQSGKHPWQAWLTPDIPTSQDNPAACAAKMKTAMSMKNVPVTFPAMYNGADELYPNFFVRKWSNCTVYLDCNTFVSDIIFPTST